MIKGPSFFPSWQLAWYVAKMFLVRTAAILIMLVLILQTLDLLGESGSILEVPGNTNADIWYYVSLRLPQLISTFLPFSVLLGTLITLVTLNQNGEVIMMKAGGMSAHQILAPLILASLGVAAVSFTFNDRIVARASATLDAWKKTDYREIPHDSGVRANVWVRADNALIHVDQVNGRGAATTLNMIEVFERSNNVLSGVVRSDKAVWTGSGWRLTHGRRFDVTTGKITPLSDAIVGQNVTPDRFTLANVDGDGLSFMELRSAINELKSAGRPTRGLEATMWHKISGPLSSILMPLLGAVAGFGLARSGNMLIRAVAGMGLGFLFFVVDNFALAMGNLGAYPPLLAAWGAFLLFLLIGEMILVRSEE